MFSSLRYLAGQRRLLSISVDPVIADYHRRRAETALDTLDTHLVKGGYLCTVEPTIADLFCFGDVAFAELCGFDLNGWTNVAGWAEKLRSLRGFNSQRLSLFDQRACPVERRFRLGRRKALGC